MIYFRAIFHSRIGFALLRKKRKRNSKRKREKTTKIKLKLYTFSSFWFFAIFLFGFGYALSMSSFVFCSYYFKALTTKPKLAFAKFVQRVVVVVGFRYVKR